VLVAKQVADILTFVRAMVAFALAWLGISQGTAGLPVAAWLLLLSWTTDALDGPIARRSSVQYHTWLGDHDLQVDMAVAAGLLIYMLEAGYVNLLVGAAYTLLWVLFFWQHGVLRSPAMLFQAPIDGWFIYLALTYSPVHGWLIVTWIAVTVVATWPRFPDEVIPGFLEGMRLLKKK
jgi:phosphatidylglycerophosphate synthase